MGTGRQREVYFLRKERDADSCVMRANQVATALRALGQSTRLVHALSGSAGRTWRNKTPVDWIHDSIIVIVKAITPGLVEELHGRNNRLVWDPCDLFSFDPAFAFEEMRLIDYVITPSRACWQVISDRFAPRVQWRSIPHHPHPRFKPTNGNAFRLAYYGSLPGTLHLDGSLSDLNLQEGLFETWLQASQHYTCHYSVRTDPQATFKPNTKISCAAACASNIIATRDAAFTELLDSSYPYYAASSDLKDVISCVEFARDSFGSGTWARGLDMMRAVLEQTRLTRVSSDYLDVFGALD